MTIELPVKSSGGPFAVRTDRLTKNYGRFLALDGIDLRVPDGAVYVLVGANGAGKSTLLRSLMHLVDVDTGDISVMGLDPARQAPLVRAQIGYVPEGQDLGYPWLTVRHLMEQHALFFPAWDAGHAARLVKAFEIDVTRTCSQLSKGQRRRVQLLLALAHRPPLLLLDEPGDGLDHVARDRTLTILTEHLADTPTTVVISTHRIYEFERLIDHVGVLHGGRLLGQMARNQLQRNLRRYSADVPDGWNDNTKVPGVVVRRARLGRGIEWTIWGEQDGVVADLTLAGAVVRDIGALTLDEAATELLSIEVSA